MDIITLDKSNIEFEHICCAIGNDPANRVRSETKKAWLADRFSQGLVFKRLNERGKVFIEYLPIEAAWKPLEGHKAMVINCLWVSGKFKNQGWAKRLLGECVEDSRNKNMNNVVVVSSKMVKPFLTDKRFFLEQGFRTVDCAHPYFELLALPLKDGGEIPRFTRNAREGKNPEAGRGFFFVYSHQCVFMEDYVHSMVKFVKGLGVPATIHKLTNAQEACKYGSPFGTLGVYYNGDFVTHELMPEKRFAALVTSLRP